MTIVLGSRQLTVLLKALGDGANVAYRNADCDRAKEDGPCLTLFVAQNGQLMTKIVAQAIITFDDSPVAIHYNLDADDESGVLTISGLLNAKREQIDRAVKAAALFRKVLRSGGAPRTTTEEMQKTITAVLEEKKKHNCATIEEAAQWAGISPSTYYEYRRRLAETPGNSAESFQK